MEKPNVESRTLFYEQLNCVPESNPEQIRAEYRRLALQFHPDKAAANEQDSKVFDLIQRAYSILNDPARRALYDRWRTSHLQIPFEVFEGLGTHAQTLHWQTLPSQPTITAASDTVSSENEVNRSIPLSDGRENQTIQIQSVWKKNDSDALYDKFRNYGL
ncbi:DnaJ domain-containing protein [Umbelopsis sp. AD052]|nr:DnaJ domain-containing protein [Umbelopsis sp. AD052]